MQAQANVMPDGQTAYNNLFQGIHQRVFFNKCAAAGFKPVNDQQASWMLDTAGRLRFVEQQSGVKQAQDGTDPFYVMNQALQAQMNKMGLDFGGEQRQAEEEWAIKGAAEELMQDPTFYNSVLALKAEEAEDLRKHSPNLNGAAA